MDLNFVAEADAASLKLEKARRALEAAKLDFENAKKAFEEILSQAEEHGIPKAKLKKLTEDRTQSLFDIGLVEAAEALPKENKTKKAPKAQKAAAKSETLNDEKPSAEEISDISDISDIANDEENDELLRTESSEDFQELALQ